MNPSRRFSNRLPSECEGDGAVRARSSLLASDMPPTPNRKFSDVFVGSSPGRRVSAQRSSIKLSTEDRLLLLNELGLNTVTYSPKKSPRNKPSNTGTSILTGTGAGTGTMMANYPSSCNLPSSDTNITPVMTSREGSVTNSANNVHTLAHSFKSVKLTHPDEIEEWFQSHPSRRNSRQLATIWEDDEECSKSGDRSPDRPGSQRRKAGF